MSGITLVEALNYRCLRQVRQPLEPFHVMVGPNASGKSTFLDAIEFLGDIVSTGVAAAVESRTPDPQGLVGANANGNRIELAVEARVPSSLGARARQPGDSKVRYQIRLVLDTTEREFELEHETLLLRNSVADDELAGGSSVPAPLPPPDASPVRTASEDDRIPVGKAAGGGDRFRDETVPANEEEIPSFRSDTGKSALGNLPDDPSASPVSTWFRDLLSKGIRRLAPDIGRIRRPAPPTRTLGLLPDGSNLAWVAKRLREENPHRHRAWIRHLRIALPDLLDIDATERPEDRRRYLNYRFAGERTVPSWLVSHGILRLTVLTLPAYLNEPGGVYLIEEPEAGIHPGSVSVLYDSLASIYDGQVLLTTHSPALLNETRPESVLCFRRDDAGATDIVSASEHPMLKDWHGNPDLGMALAAGVLG